MSKFEIVQVGDRYNNRAAIMIERRLLAYLRLCGLRFTAITQILTGGTTRQEEIVTDMQP